MQPPELVQLLVGLLLQQGEQVLKQLGPRCCLLSQWPGCAQQAEEFVLSAEPVQAVASGWIAQVLQGFLRSAKGSPQALAGSAVRCSHSLWLAV